jgi:GH24 family phage-related lysozyme (muramidase)
VTTTAEFIAGFEGFAGRAYWDVNAWRLGYGSDTEGPDQVHVTEGMETTKARALQNLALRIPQFQTEAVYSKTGMGRDTWERLTGNQQTAITSLVYNYGRLPIIVTPSDPDKTAAAIRALQNANGGVNRHRRIAEAAFYLTPPVAAVTQPAPQPATQAPVPQVPIPQAPAPPTPPPTAPAGPSPISATIAGLDAAILDHFGAILDALTKQRDAINVRIAKIQAQAADFATLEGAETSSMPPLLQQLTAKPAATPQPQPQPQGIQTMLGKSWITSLFGTGSIAGAAATVAFDIANKQMPDTASMSLIFSSVMAGMGLLQAKDKNVTGGTIPQTLEAMPRAASPPIPTK